MKDKVEFVHYADMAEAAGAAAAYSADAAARAEAYSAVAADALELAVKMAEAA